jgi:hypothetical protein
VNVAWLRKPKAACFLSYVEYRPNTNINNIMKNRPCLQEFTYKMCGGGVIKRKLRR